MCKAFTPFGFDFNGDGEVSFEESYLTYRIGEDIINSSDDNDDDFDNEYDYDGNGENEDY